jgi:diacylglycerol kinase (ATP)
MNQSIAREKILFIINPVSGTKYKGHLPELIKRLIDKSFFEAEVIFSKYKGEATEIVSRKSGEGYRYFVAVGGDGTVNEIAKALINTKAILGIIPVGSGNGLARHLHIPLRPENAIQLINKQKVEAIDCGMINNVPFFCTCGVGFDALIGEKFAVSKGRGLYNYIKTTVLEFFNYKPENYQVTIDDQPPIRRTAFLVTVANASQYGNNAYIAPNADIRDGQLDLCILSPFRLCYAPVIGARLFLKNINKSSLMFSQRATKIRLERASGGVIHFDGEPVRMEKILDISLINNGLNILIP